MMSQTDFARLMAAQVQFHKSIKIDFFVVRINFIVFVWITADSGTSTGASTTKE